MVKVAAGNGGMESLEELITRELKEAFDEFDKVRSLLRQMLILPPSILILFKLSLKAQLRASISTRISASRNIRYNTFRGFFLSSFSLILLVFS